MISRLFTIAMMRSWDIRDKFHFLNPKARAKRLNCACSVAFAFRVAKVVPSSISHGIKMSAPKKKKGLSLDDKREVMLGIVRESGDVFNLKDLERLGSKNGVVEKTVKDVVQSLVDDKFIEVGSSLYSRWAVESAGFRCYSLVSVARGLFSLQVDKIGAGNFYWSFPSASFIKFKVEVDTLASQIAAEEKAIGDLEARIKSLTSGREDSVRVWPNLSMGREACVLSCFLSNGSGCCSQC